MPLLSTTVLVSVQPHKHNDTLVTICDTSVTVQYQQRERTDNTTKWRHVRLSERASTRLSAAAAPSVQQLGSRLTRPSSNCSAGPRTAVAQLQQPVHLVDEPGKTSHMQHTHCRCQPRALGPGQARGGLGIPACAYGLQQPVQRCAASHRRDHGAVALDLAGTVTVVAAGAGGDASKPVVGRAERAAHPASGCFGAPKSCFGTFYSS